VILARLISPENFGIAATFAMTYALIEMVSNFSAQSLLVQASDGDSPEFQACGHLLLITRGAANFAILLLIAGPLSSLFGVPEARWAFCWVAAVPLIRGFIHLDTSRFQRTLRFGPTVTVDCASSIIVTLIAWPVALWLRSYSAMLWLLLLQALLYALGTHVAAERRYRWSWNREYGRRFFTFGWPLLLNGLLMYGILQGDRFIIGASRRILPHSTLTLADLGIYSVAFSITMAPGSLFSGMSSSLFLPLLSRVQAIPQQFARRLSACNQLLALSALAIGIPFITVGAWVVPGIYGAKYAGVAPFIGYLGAMWALRVFRNGPTIAAMALGDTRNNLISNIVRSLALLGVVASVAAGLGLTAIAISGLVGEALATIVCIWRLGAVHRVSVAPLFRTVLILSMGMILAAVLGRTFVSGVLTGFLLSATLFTFSALAMLLFFPELAQELRRLPWNWQSRANTV
jgi:O-antigen/teichoic acid export membrane protein